MNVAEYSERLITRFRLIQFLASHCVERWSDPHRTVTHNSDVSFANLRNVCEIWFLHSRVKITIDKISTQQFNKCYPVVFLMAQILNNIFSDTTSIYLLFWTTCFDLSQFILRFIYCLAIQWIHVGRVDQETWNFAYRGADKSLARRGRNQATATEDSEFHISYL